MSERQNGGPAFPCTEQRGTRLNIDGDQEPLYVRVSGMSLRDYFAAAALTTFSNNSPFAVSGQEHFARRAYEIADAMLSARNHKGE